MAGQSTGTNLSSWHVTDTEIGYNLEKDDITKGDTQAEEWKLYVAKIMPLIEKDHPKDTPTTLQVSSLFLNVKDCWPTINTLIYSRNYVVASRPANCSFTYPCKMHNMQLEVEVLHSNLDNLRITNTIDNSVPL